MVRSKGEITKENKVAAKKRAKGSKLSQITGRAEISTINTAICAIFGDSKGSTRRMERPTIGRAKGKKKGIGKTKIPTGRWRQGPEHTRETSQGLNPTHRAPWGQKGCTTGPADLKREGSKMPMLSPYLPNGQERLSFVVKNRVGQIRAKKECRHKSQSSTRRSDSEKTGNEKQEKQGNRTRT